MLIVLLWLMWTTLWSALIYNVNFDNNQALIIHDIFRAREEIHHTSLHLSWEERRVACERSLAACRAVATPVTSTHSIWFGLVFTLVHELQGNPLFKDRSEGTIPPPLPDRQRFGQCYPKEKSNLKLHH